MNDEPRPDAPRDAGTPDPLDDTQRIEVPRYAPTPDPRPDARWAWASPTPGPSQGAAPGGQTGWTQPAGTAPGAAPQSPPPAWGAPVAGTPPPAYGAPAYSAPVQPAVAPKRRGGAGIGTVVTASLLSAVLAAGGTVLLLDQTGALDQTVVTASTGTSQQTGAQQPVTIDESSAVIDAAAKAGPAVVKITTTTGSGDTGPFGTDIPSSGVGSGVIYDANGWILTNRHVVEGATNDTVTVELRDGRQFAGRVYGIDTLTDLAIVKVDEPGLPVAPVGTSDNLKIGQLVVAIGSPLGMYSFSVTSGILSGKGRDIVVDSGQRITNLLQTDAAINPGNSGGPLVDATGAVVGINTAVATDSSGIGFAIPIDIARPIMQQAVAGEELSRPWIGIRFESIDQKVKAAYNLTVDNGAYVSVGAGGGSAIVENSPAAKAGLQDGDIILSINGIVVDQEHPLDALLVQFKPDDTIRLDVLRDGAQVQLDVTLGTRPGNL
ncbi:MAG TPA: trypsin-like peptidase domain-containing protein [Candidatus Limnocylindrales bacterium]|nr:trypsin-like peptidase domain-containing protein [Candidatus Limnocylindrales bacterium]